jgi:hypothetical protein
MMKHENPPSRPHPSPPSRIRPALTPPPPRAGAFVYVGLYGYS